MARKTWKHILSPSYIPGEMRDFAIWSRPLTADELAALSIGVSPFLIAPDALVEWMER